MHHRYYVSVVTQHALFTKFRQYPLIPGSDKSPRRQSVGKCSVGGIIAIDVLHVYHFKLFTSSHVLTHGLPPRSNGPVFIFVYHTLRLCAMYCVILCSSLSSLMLSSHLVLGRSFFSFPALACLTSSWWYSPLPSLTRDHTITVVSFSFTLIIIILFLMKYIIKQMIRQSSYSPQFAYIHHRLGPHDRW